MEDMAATEVMVATAEVDTEDVSQRLLLISRLILKQNVSHKISVISLSHRRRLRWLWRM